MQAWSFAFDLGDPFAERGGKVVQVLEDFFADFDEHVVELLVRPAAAGDQGSPSHAGIDRLRVSIRPVRRVRRGPALPAVRW